jgi:hypothetical protein
MWRQLTRAAAQWCSCAVTALVDREKVALNLSVLVELDLKEHREDPDREHQGLRAVPARHDLPSCRA